MLTFTIQTTTGPQTVTMPASWRQVTVERYAAMYGKTGIDLLAALAGLPVETMQQLPEHYLAYLFSSIGFLEDEIPEIVPAEIAAVKVGQLQVGQIEKAKELLSKLETWQAAPYVVAIYATTPYKEAAAWALAEQYKQQPITELYGSFVFLLNQITAFYAQYAPILNKEPDEDEIAAGVDRFSTYGFFGTLVSKCNGNPLQYDEMAKVPADVFYLTLCFEQEKADYQEELQKIKSMTNPE